MSFGDKVAIASLCFTFVTTLCALFLAFTALAHTVRPRIQISLATATVQPCAEEVVFTFELSNPGHWYGSPTAVDVTVFCNFDSAIQLREIRYGSVQEYSSTEIRAGVGHMKFLKAKGLKISHREEGEHVKVYAISPSLPGRYRIWISAYSANGASLGKEFWLECVV